MKRKDLVEGETYAVKIGYTGGKAEHLSKLTLVELQRYYRPSWRKYGDVKPQDDGQYFKMRSESNIDHYVMPAQIVRTWAENKKVVKAEGASARKAREERERREAEIRSLRDELNSRLAKVGIPLKFGTRHDSWGLALECSPTTDEAKAAVKKLTALQDALGGWPPGRTK